MDIRDKQAILKNAFDSNGIYAENDTLLLRQILPSDKEPYLDIYRAKEGWAMLFERLPESADTLWDALLDADTLNTIIIRKSDHKFCGFCGLQQYVNLIEPELSIELVKDCQHQGIGTQVLPMLMKRFSEITGANAFISKVSQRNFASQGLMRKLGGILQESEINAEFAAKAEQISQNLSADQTEAFGSELANFRKYILVFRFVI